MDIYRWEAKRAGASMTVHGFDPDDKPVKITGVKTIKPTKAATAWGAVIGVDAAGEAHRLMLRG